MAIASLTLHRFDRIRDRLWVLGQMGAARLTLPRVPGIGFWKLCGSGTGEGFTPVPNTRVWAILATGPDLATAERQTETAHPFTAWARRASERWTVFLAPTSQRGAWSGQRPFAPEEPPGPGPVAALTRATVRPRAALRFWARTPAISGVIGADPNVALKIGIGEVPWMQQVTFSVWPDTGAMAAFARDPAGPHAQAIRAVREGAWFREELYARFRPLSERGTWEGRQPLASLTATPAVSSCVKYPGGSGGLAPRPDRLSDRLPERTAP